MTILGLYKIYYGIFKGRTKGGERWMGDKHELENRERGIKEKVACREAAGQYTLSKFAPDHQSLSYPFKLYF